VDNFIAALRTKLEEDPAHPQHLVTVRGVGYRLDVPLRKDISRERP
jgi:DNA-binding response OmpR family regulator